MKDSRPQLLVLAVFTAAVAATAILLPPSASTNSYQPGNNVLARAVDIELGKVKPHQWEQRLSSGSLYAALAGTGVLEERANAVQGGHKGGPNSPSCAQKFVGGGTGDATNVRVNQDCSLRRQAEEVVVANPTNPNNLIAGQNDSRIGFNHCGYDWSFDGGKTWGDQTPPFWQFLLLDGRTTDACSDPTATFDADGNAYIGGIIFNVSGAANAIVVAKSNAGIGGAFYHTPAPLSFQTSRTVPLGVIANDNNADIFNDKEFIVADADPGSPNKNNVYATWTRFNFATGAGLGQNSPIFFSQSTDGGATWSAGIEISGSAAVCTDFSGSANPNACDQDQGSHPIVGPDGSIYVIFGNSNTPLTGENQVLFVRCPDIGGDPATTNCANAANWSDPVRINDLIGTHPLGPAPATGCPAGRGCLPPNGYRVPEFTSMSISVDDGDNLYAVWSDSRNIGANCDFDADGDGDPDFGSAATATPPCDNDVFYSFSTDGGATWSSEINVAPAAAGFGPTAQWQPWSEVTSPGNVLVVIYYDRSYGTCEGTGCNDITAALIRDPRSASPTITYRRVTTSSMPNLTPANNPLQAGFLGDYPWVDVEEDGANPRAHIAWADTRGRNGTIEEDIYYATLRAR